MMAYFRMLVSDVLERKSRYMWRDNGDIRRYFRNEYKNEADYAYEHWLNTGKGGYASR